MASPFSQTINQLIKQIQLETNLILVIQDKEAVALIAKGQTIKEFLDEEIRLILKKIQAFQKPKVSSFVGNAGTGMRSFDETVLRVHGPVRRVAVNCGWWVDGLQITYGNHQSVQHGKGGDKKEFSLSHDERITKICVGTGIMSLPPHHWWTNGIDSIEFFTNKGRRYGPYGCGHGKVPPEKKEFSFGEDYYFSAIKGEMHGEVLRSISFIFQRDVSSLITGELSPKIESVLGVIQQHPEINISKEKSQIEEGMRHRDFSVHTEEDPYQILGARREMSLQVISRLKNTLLRQFHTDKLPLQERYKESFYKEKCQQIQQAYEQIEKEKAGSSQ